MPIILRAYLDKEKKFKYVGKTVDHESKYTIYCKLKSQTYVTEFSQSDLSDKTSLFFDENNKSKTFKWFEQINSEIDKVDRIER